MKFRKAHRAKVDRLPMRQARYEIVDAANRHTISWGHPYSMRTIQKAVCKVRRQGLVKPEVLVAAGFNAKER